MNTKNSSLSMPTVPNPINVNAHANELSLGVYEIDHCANQFHSLRKQQQN